MVKTSKPKDLMSSRPPPPSFAEMSEDISAAHDGDVIFYPEETGIPPSFSETSDISEHSGGVTLSPKHGSDRSLNSTAGGDSGGIFPGGATCGDSPAPSVDAVYNQALEFIASTDWLKTELSHQRDVHSRLRLTTIELNKSLELMKQHIDDLQKNTKLSPIVNDSPGDSLL